MQQDTDLAIIGSGFGGSILSMIARRIGLSVALIEKTSHPRFAIGESTSPLANLILEQISDRYDLPRLKPLAQYGDWKLAYPEIVCGLKRGFTYFKHERGERYSTASNRSNQLLVAASPNDFLADTHWLRSSVDHFLVKEAVSLGAIYMDRTNLTTFDQPSGKLTGERDGRRVQIRAPLVIDAGGPRSFLSRQLNIVETGFRNYPGTQSLYSHFTGVKRCDRMRDYLLDAKPPYPMDDAALHHVFDGGWMWILRFDNGVTSAGIAVTDELANELRLSEGEPAWRRFLERFPSIKEQFDDAAPVMNFVYQQRLSYRAEAAAGPNWAMLPSAAAFIDPLFSTGIPLTLLGIERLGKILEASGGSLCDYSDITMSEVDRTADFISACYRSFPNFEFFTAYSMFYFAAASFSEMARRLDRSRLVSRFLASGHPQFGKAMSELGSVIGSQNDISSFRSRISAAVDCLNVAGLCDESKDNWYDVDLYDLILNARKLEISPEEMYEIIKTANWARVDKAA